MQSLSPKQVIHGFNRHEPNAVRWVYDTYYPGIASFVESISGITPDTADLVEEVFAKLMEQRRYFDKVQTIRRFLYSTAKNSCLNYNKHRRIVESKSEEVARYYQDIEEDTVRAAEAEAVYKDMYLHAIEGMPKKFNEIFRLSVNRDLSNAEIAAALGISEKTVLNRKSAAKKALKADIRKRTDKFF
jgi:RNA polymerase sigma-70 factor (ECF subfamily)